jgi:FKBP-type peptidyl-prolyl cis-trans isomerase FklB
MAFQKDMQEKQMAKQVKMAEPNKIAGQKFLDENKGKEGVKVTATGLQYKVIKEGKGKTPTANDKVTVNYEGKLLDGKIFDSSFDRKKPETFPVTGVIKGWTEGLMLMKEGGSYELYIPSDLAYGDAGNNSIPGGSTLIFKVDLIKVEGAAPADAPKKDNQKKTK